MAEKNLLINEAIEVVYQAPNKQSGLSGVVAEIYLPDGEKDSNFPDVALAEMASSGVYKGEFTPNVQGEWKAVCHKSDGDGQVVRRYSVGAHNVHSVGSQINAVDTKINAVDAQLDTVETKIDDIDTKVSSLDTPPMVS